MLPACLIDVESCDNAHTLAVNLYKAGIDKAFGANPERRRWCVIRSREYHDGLAVYLDRHPDGPDAAWHTKGVTLRQKEMQQVGMGWEEAAAAAIEALSGMPWRKTTIYEQDQPEPLVQLVSERSAWLAIGDTPAAITDRTKLNLLRHALPLIVCKNDTDGDGDCGRHGCPICGIHGLRTTHRI